MSVWKRAADEADLVLPLPGALPMFFRRIPSGRFRMGSRGYSADEEPVHWVEISREFYLGTFVVTQEQYRAVATRCPALKQRAEPSHFKGPRRPVEGVDWHQARAFCAWLARWKGLPEGIADVRLPTEAEWDHACRGGSPLGCSTEYYAGDGESALREIAWFATNSEGGTHAVDERGETHPWGLHGMHGNVWEWCLDGYDEGAYRKRGGGECVVDPYVDPAPYQTRVLRGGSWIHSARNCRSAFRSRWEPDDPDWIWIHGFRVCLVPGPFSSAADSPAEAEPGAGDGGDGTEPQSDAPGAAGAGRGSRAVTEGTT